MILLCAFHPLDCTHHLMFIIYYHQNVKPNLKNPHIVVLDQTFHPKIYVRPIRKSAIERNEFGIVKVCVLTFSIILARSSNMESI